VSTSVTPCAGCGRDTATTDDRRCEYCGRPKPVTVEPVPAAMAAEAPRLWEDLRPQIVAAAVSLLIAVVGLMIGSALLLVTAGVLLVAAALAKIVADGW
jgi:hypothetical protein